MPDYGIGSWPARRARISGTSVALRQGALELSYAALADRVERLARALAERGTGHRDRVVYLGPNDIATFVTFFAAGRLGAVFVPLNTRLTATEIGHLLDDARPTALVHGPQFDELVAELVAGLEPDTTIIPVAGSGPDGYRGLTDGTGRCPPLDAEVSLADDAVILYTSGTTGRPKGAVLSHQNLTFNTMNQLAHVDVLSTDVALCTAPLFHATGLGQVSLPTIFKGGTVVVAAKFDPAWMLTTIAEQGIASFSAVPTMLQMLCDHPDFATTDLSSLRFVIYGGSTVAERVAIAWQRRGVRMLQGYGMTEASPGVYLAAGDGAVERPVSIGVPHFFTDVSVTFGDSSPIIYNDSDEASGRSGELLVRGLNVFRGYWNQPAETQNAFTDGWFHSGDIVRIAKDGWAYLLGRSKDIIISGGENIYPAEVEAAINALAGVRDSAVIAEDDEKWGEVGLAFVMTEHPAEWTEKSLRAALSATLAGYKIPKYVHFVDDLPRTATGKVRKHELRAIWTSH